MSVNPITVTYNQGQNPELWDVRVSLQPNEQQPRGRMTIDQTTAAGGTYEALLPARLLITFIRRSDNMTRLVPFGVLLGANQISWSFNANAALVTDHHFCPTCLAGEQGTPAGFAGPQMQWELQTAHF
jgi:hypothetical protein